MDGSKGAGQTGSQTVKLGWTTGVGRHPSSYSKFRFTALVHVVPSAWKALLPLISSYSFLRTQFKQYFFLLVLQNKSFCFPYFPGLLHTPLTALFTLYSKYLFMYLEVLSGQRHVSLYPPPYPPPLWPTQEEQERWDSVQRVWRGWRVGKLGS